MIFVLASFGFHETIEVKVPKTLKVLNPELVTFPERMLEQSATEVSPPFLGTSFNGFKEALAFRESRGDYFIINTLGYLGKYQFGIGTLQLMGVYDATRFLRDPRLQEKVFHTNIARNKWILRKDIHRFEGRKIRGIEITESGILAAAHLAGAGNVRKFLRTNGRFNTKDAYGTHISDYLSKFSGYDTSEVMPQRNPRI